MIELIYEDELSNLLLNISNNNTLFKFTNSINLYKNKNDKKCINEFEIVEKISRGLIWKVYKVKRYYYTENIENECKTENYALKKSHINTQKKRRFYLNDQLYSYFDKLIEEIKIHSILKNEYENIIKLYEVIYNPNNQFIYLITEYADLGTIMNKHEETYEFYHNNELINYLINLHFSDQNIIFEKENNLIKRNSLNLEIKHKISKILFKQIFIGLSNLHKNKISHRDIKPDNIVFSTNDNQCKLIDFSHSKICDNNLINDMGGSIHFQDPEMFNQYYDPYKADIWSVGITLYLFLFEKLPFDSDSELELQMKIINKEIEFENNSNINITNFLYLLLQKNPENRLTNIEEILNQDFFN